MAEALFREIISAEASNWKVGSAGTWASRGHYAAENTLEVLAERDLDASEHRSQPVKRELLEQFQLTLVMESGHKEALQIEFPDLSAKIYLISEMVGEKLDVYDPIGGPRSDFEDMAREVESYLQDGLEMIREKAAEQSVMRRPD